MLAPTTTPLETARRAPVKGWQIGAAFAVLAALYVVGFFAGGEAGDFMLAGLNALPLTLVAVFAYLGEDRIWARVAALIALVLLIGGYALYGVGLSLTALLAPGGGLQLQPGHGLQLLLIFLGTALAPLVGGLTAIPAVRRGLSRVLPLDPQSFVQAIALVTVVTLLIMSFIPLLVLGAPPLLSAVSNATQAGKDLLGGRNAAGQLRDQLYGLIWTIPCAVLAVGWGVRRNLREALTRLGLVRPTGRQVLAALGLAMLAVVASRLLDLGTAWVWGQLGWPVTNGEAFGQLLAYAMSPLGAVVVGVSAGLGEELAVRGVLQPRMGLLLSNVLFTSLHAFQYNWDALLGVFLVGLFLGLVRKRSNTTTSAIVHGTYDFLLVMATVLQIPWFS